MLGLKDKDINIQKEVLSGLTVAIALVPEAIAFSFIVGIDPIYGIYSAFMIGLISSLFGGRAGMISGATGAVAVVYAPLVATHGIEYMFLAVILAGIIQIIFGLLDIGKFVRLIPHAVMIGFVNGLALVIFRSQLDLFKIDGVWLTGSMMLVMLILTALTMFIILFLPKYFDKVPSSLIAIVVVTLLSLVIRTTGVEILTISDFAGGSIKAGLPSIHIPDVVFGMETFKIVFPFALIAATVGLIESLLTLNLIDEITDTRGSTKKESIAQGIANICTGFISGMGGCAMIGQSTININSGARKYLSGFVAAIGLLLIVLVFYPLIDMIPLAAIVGVMFVVVYKTFEWDSFKNFKVYTNFDIFIILQVMFVTLQYNLALAVIIGVILSALHFAWIKSVQVNVTNEANIYKFEGTLFFGSVLPFKEKVIYSTDDKEVIFDVSKLNIVDYSAVNAIEAVHDKFANKGVRLKIVNLKEHDKKMMKRAKIYDEII